jgi:hypothetical protein
VETFCLTEFFVLYLSTLKTESSAGPQFSFLVSPASCACFELSTVPLFRFLPFQNNSLRYSGRFLPFLRAIWLDSVASLSAPLPNICTGQKLEKRDLCLYKVETACTNRRHRVSSLSASLIKSFAPHDIYPLWALRQLYPAHKVESARELFFLFLEACFTLVCEA